MTVFSIRIDDPLDIRYPFGRELYEEVLVVYHGTASVYCPEIEREGLTPQASARRVEQIGEILVAYKALGLESRSMYLLKGLVPGTVGKDPRRPMVYVAQGYWHARDYATNPGGETLDFALKAADEFLKLIEDPHIQTRYSKEDVSRFQRQVERCRDRLREQTSSGYPVVYAVRIEREWCLRWQDPYEAGGFRFCDINVRCEQPVPPGRLLARVDYVRGARAGYENHSFIPKTWEEARALRVTPLSKRT